MFCNCARLLKKKMVEIEPYTLHSKQCKIDHYKYRDFKQKPISADKLAPAGEHMRHFGTDTIKSTRHLSL